MVKKPAPIQPDDPLLSPKEVAARLKLHVISLKNLRLRGQGPPWIKPSGRRVYYPQRLFEEWLNKTLVIPEQDRVA
jgi:hypothetical protein